MQVNPDFTQFFIVRNVAIDCLEGRVSVGDYVALLNFAIDEGLRERGMMEARD